MLRTDDSRWVDVATVAVMAAMAAVVWTDPLRFSHDPAVLLDVGARILDGQVPYVDYVENNPPLIHYLHAIPVWLARALGGTAIGWFKGLALAVTFASIAWARLRMPRFGEVDHAPIVALAWAGFSYSVLMSKNLGQREHLFVLLALPYLITRLRRAEDREHLVLAVLAGLAAGLGTCIKPHFLLPMAAIEVGLLWQLRRRWLGPEVLAGLAVAAGYGLFLLAMPAISRHAYLDVWVPALMAGYETYGHPPPIIRSGTRYLVFQLVVVAAAAWVFLRGAQRRTSLLLLAGAASAVVVYALQAKGWQYHRIPANALTALGAAFVVAEVLRSLPRGRVLVLAMAAWMLLPVAEVVDGVGRVADKPITARMAQLTRRGDPVLFVSSNLWQAYPGVLMLERPHVATYPMAFPLSVVYPNGRLGGYRSPFNRPVAEKVFVRDLMRDLDKKPVLVAIESNATCNYCANGVGFPSYLEHIGFLAALREGWTPVGRSSQCDLWLRNDRALGQRVNGGAPARASGLDLLRRVSGEGENGEEAPTDEEGAPLDANGSDDPNDATE